MKKGVENNLFLSVDSFFFILALALLFLAFEAVGSSPAVEAAVGGRKLQAPSQ